MPLAPPTWTRDQLERDRRLAIDAFRRERLAESVESTARAYDDYAERFRALLGESRDLLHLAEAAPKLFQDRRLLDAVRYLCAPPISEDDLKVLADIPSLAPSRLAESPEHRAALLDTVTAAIDPRRFPWLGDRRVPDDIERAAAITASASLASAQRVATNRRTRSKTDQEQAVCDVLVAAGFQQVPARTVDTIAHAPAPGEFCSECLVGSRQADILLSTFDHRMMAIECKVSNSSTNSIKRLNNDAAVKAVSWRRDFGERHVVPVAVLSGVYKLHNLEDAQTRGLTLMWAHDLEPLTRWLEETRPDP